MVQSSKVQGLPQAIARLVRPGMSIVMGAGLEACIPFAAGHEIIRQRKKDLTLIGPISDCLFDMMIGGGVVKRIIAAWVGNVGAGLGYNFRRAAENETIEVENHSNLSVAVGLDAGGMGLEFGLLRSLFGTDISDRNENMRIIPCPFTGTPHLAVRAITPDLAIIHAQRADENGNTHLWGNLGIVPEAIKASRQVLVVVEEIVSREVIRSDPNRTVIPGFKVAAVVEEPWGAHPSPVQGYYGHDDEFFMEYAEATRDPESAERWNLDWVLKTADRPAYLDRLTPKRLEALKVKNPAPAAEVEFGY